MKIPISEDEEIPYSADMADFIDIDEGLCWECVHCGNCCGNIFTRTWLDTALKEYVGEPVDRYCKHYDRKNGQCLIHPRRPNICRGYPFIMKKSGDHYKLCIHSKCSGIGKGPELDIREKLMEVLRLAEEDLDCDFMVERSDDPRNMKIFRIK